jgi:hypothetical protein
MDNLKKRIASFQNAWKGILHGFKSEVHFRFHVFGSIILLETRSLGYEERDVLGITNVTEVDNVSIKHNTQIFVSRCYN